MGSSVKMDYTIIGEPVNTAARLEDRARTLDTPVLMTTEVAAAAGRDWDIRFVGAYDINSGDPIRVHSLATGATDMASMRSTIATYLDALTRLAVLIFPERPESRAIGDWGHRSIQSISSRKGPSIASLMSSPMRVARCLRKGRSPMGRPKIAGDSSSNETEMVCHSPGAWNSIGARCETRRLPEARSSSKVTM